MFIRLKILQFPVIFDHYNVCTQKNVKKKIENLL